MLRLRDHPWNFDQRHRGITQIQDSQFWMPHNQTVHYSVTEIINKYDTRDGLQAKQAAQHRGTMYDSKSMLIARHPESQQENRCDRQPMAKRVSTEEKSLSLTSLPPLPPILFSTLFLLSFGNHIVWDYFLWEQEGSVEGKTKRLWALCMTVLYVFFHVCSQTDTLLHQRWKAS